MRDQSPTCLGFVSTNSSSFPESDGTFLGSVRLGPGLQFCASIRVAVASLDTSIAHTMLPPGDARRMRNSFGVRAFFSVKLCNSLNSGEKQWTTGPVSNTGFPSPCTTSAELFLRVGHWNCCLTVPSSVETNCNFSCQGSSCFSLSRRESPPSEFFSLYHTASNPGRTYWIPFSPRVELSRLCTGRARVNDVFSFGVCANALTIKQVITINTTPGHVCRVLWCETFTAINACSGREPIS